jgi:hypothetical protein
MVASVYVALSGDALGDGQKSCFNDPSIQKMWKTRWQKVAPTDAPRKRSKKMKVDVDYALAESTPYSGSVSTADFNKSEWKIMYPLFMAEGLIDPPTHVIR